VLLWIVRRVLRGFLCRSFRGSELRAPIGVFRRRARRRDNLIRSASELTVWRFLSCRLGEHYRCRCRGWLWFGFCDCSSVIERTERCYCPFPVSAWLQHPHGECYASTEHQDENCRPYVA
jgi:hypothetical protein